MTTWIKPPLVTEHEDAHYWPDGEYDGPADDDCAFCTGLMQFLAHHPGGAAATLAEAELIRHAAGLTPSGPAGSDDVIRGLQALLGWAPVAVAGWDALWAALRPGMSATLSGIPTAAPAGSPPRHWLPNYASGHKLFAERLDTTDRVWLMDPEGPAGGTYKGEWCSKSDLEAFASAKRADGSTPVHTVASIAVAKVTRKVACDGGFLWTLPRNTSGSVKRNALVAGEVATITGTVAGGAWSFSCPMAKKGTGWYRVSELNGVKLPVPLYGATGRFLAA